MADIKANEKYVRAAGSPLWNYTLANGGGARDTDNYLFASKRFYHPFLPVLLASKERPRDDTKIKSRSGQTERYGRLWCSGRHTALYKFRILNVAFKAASPRSIELQNDGSEDNKADELDTLSTLTSSHVIVRLGNNLSCLFIMCNIIFLRNK